eukprot:764018-Hanusia_phi.AAC.4
MDSQASLSVWLTSAASAWQIRHARVPVDGARVVGVQVGAFVLPCVLSSPSHAGKGLDLNPHIVGGSQVLDVVGMKPVRG